MGELRVVMEPHAPDHLKQVVQEGIDLYSVAATGVAAYYPYVPGHAVAAMGLGARMLGLADAALSWP